MLVTLLVSKLVRSAYLIFICLGVTKANSQLLFSAITLLLKEPLVLLIAIVEF